ncbi:MAG TPA: hypothetical protein VHG53_05855 [Candidatus Limnocylindria bacterium]|nr:hypothetical protein [Candidatus Limnocylindria bacterium]
MPLVGIEEFERLRESALLSLGEAGERLKEFGREAEAREARDRSTLPNGAAPAGASLELLGRQLKDATGSDIGQRLFDRRDGVRRVRPGIFRDDEPRRPKPDLVLLDPDFQLGAIRQAEATARLGR